MREREFFGVLCINKDFTNKSIVTVGSPDSIFETRDWLDFIILAKSFWVIFRERRRF